MNLSLPPHELKRMQMQAMKENELVNMAFRIFVNLIPTGMEAKQATILSFSASKIFKETAHELLSGNDSSVSD